MSRIDRTHVKKIINKKRKRIKKYLKKKKNEVLEQANVEEGSNYSDLLGCKGSQKLIFLFYLTLVLVTHTNEKIIKIIMVVF